MKTTQKLTMAVIFGIFSLSVTAVLAADVTAKGPLPFSTWDADGSGGISEQEFNIIREQHQAAVKDSGRLGRGMANAASFTDIDTDNNGAISAQELNTYQMNRRATRGMGQGKGMGNGRGQGGMGRSAGQNN